MAKQKLDTHNVEVTSVKEKDYGVEVCLRAWKGDKQIGFSKDGSVDIERFRFFNKDLIKDIDGVNLKGKLKKEVDHTIGATHNLDESKIKLGKVGSTVSTLYPSANANDATIDVTNASWATCRNALTGNLVDDSTLWATARTSGGYAIFRSFISWDTSVVGSDTVSSVVLSLAGSGGGVNNADTSDIDIVAATPNDPEDIVAGDYDQVGSTVFASLALASWTASVGVYNNFPALSEAGRAEINGEGWTTYGLRNSRDTDNAACTGWNECPSRASNVGTTKPKLVVTHEVSGWSGGSVSGVASASIASRDTKALANIGSINTV